MLSCEMVASMKNKSLVKKSLFQSCSWKQLGAFWLAPDVFSTQRVIRKAVHLGVLVIVLARLLPVSLVHAEEKGGLNHSKFTIIFKSIYFWIFRHAAILQSYD